MSASLEERVRTIICDQLAVEQEKVTPPRHLLMIWAPIA
jgi:acyl carrier protein